MSPRLIQLPLSGGDRKALAKGVRYAHGLHASLMTKSAEVRQAGEAQIREADRLECEAWNAVMWAGGPAQPSPSIGRAINGGYDLLEVKCNKCSRVSIVPLRSLSRSSDTPLHVLEAALFCEPCSSGRVGDRRQRAHILGLTYARPDPEPTTATAGK